MTFTVRQGKQTIASGLDAAAVEVALSAARSSGRGAIVVLLEPVDERNLVPCVHDGDELVTQEEWSRRFAERRQELADRALAARRTAAIVRVLRQPEPKPAPKPKQVWTPRPVTAGRNVPELVRYETRRAHPVRFDRPSIEDHMRRVERAQARTGT